MIGGMHALKFGVNFIAAGATWRVWKMNVPKHVEIGWRMGNHVVVLRWGNTWLVSHQGWW